MIKAKPLRIVFAAVIAIMAGGPALAQVTRIDTLQYPNVVLPKQEIRTFNTDYLYTISLKVYGHEQFLSTLNQSDNDRYVNTYFNGLALGFNNNQMTYRLQASHYRNDGFGSRSCADCGEAVGNFRNTAVKAGLQYHINYLRLQPYLGVDLGAMIQRQEAGYTTADGTSLLTDRKVAALASPFLGVRVFIIPKVSLAAEANFNIAHSFQKTSGGMDGERTKHAWETFYAPVAGITLQYHFGSLAY